MIDDVKGQASSSSSFVPVCAIGASAGGVTALQDLFQRLPNDLGLCYVVILHLAPNEPSLLVGILQSCTKMPVLPVADRSVLRPNCVFVIQPDWELVVDGDDVTTVPFNSPHGQRMPIDRFLRSIATGRGDGIAVLLSGAGNDGSSGIRSVKEAGGIVMVQKPAETEFAAMPQNALATGNVDFVAPVAGLVDHIRDVARAKQATRSIDAIATDDLLRILTFLQSRTGHDFSGYKHATVMRRIMRRMQVNRKETIGAYIDYLFAVPGEAQLLFTDFLISVTSFFRDPSAFDTLRRAMLDALFDDTRPGGEEGLRIWTVGCATGEEAYSIAILLLEEAERRKIYVPIQIFATDLDEAALSVAREGRYPRSIVSDVAQDRLERFFVDEGNYYRVRKELRDVVLFASHSVLREPPFLRLDLVSCRNLMIYLDRPLQRQMATVFHYALKPGRFLFLGSAETADLSSDLFSPVDREARLYATRLQPASTLPILPQFTLPDRQAVPQRVAPFSGDPQGSPLALHTSALEENGHPSALVDEDGKILHLSPTAGRFILLPDGPVSTLLTGVVRPELRLDLGTALVRAIEQRLHTLTRGVVTVFEGDTRLIAMMVSPVLRGGNAVPQALVVFLDIGLVERAVEVSAAHSEENPRLHAELKATQEALVASRHGHDVALQDLRAANEELQSSNEEHRSTAEELATFKEELHSINEELRTMLAEQKSKLDSISVAHNDLLNMTVTTDIAHYFFPQT